MDWAQALEEMEKGNHLHCGDWGFQPDTYLAVEDFNHKLQFYMYNKHPCGSVTGEDVQLYGLTYADIKSTKWVVVD